jgi:hypothetical protein
MLALKRTAAERAPGAEKIPPWDCRNDAARKRLERWTQEQLNLLREPPGLRELPDDLYRELRMHSDASYMSSTEERLGKKLKRGRVIAAVEALGQLTDNDPELRTLALQLFRKRQPGRGRKKGQSRSGEPTKEERRAFEAALKDVDRIREIWKREFGRRNRKESPTASQIAARRHRVDQERLENYRKNRNRASAS